MRVFCPEHKKGFFAPRQSPIKCENRGHVLGDLDFEGTGKSAAALQWQYCCNCEHFCPIDFANDPLERCPVCTRRASTIYLCDRCNTISFESNTPLQTKNFTVSADGVPQPSCPGCLQTPSVDLREHNCDALGITFTTALNVCPVCRERLDVGPSFPSLVGLYLKKTRVANKTNVTFDYESELFVPVADGEFVLIRNSEETMQSYVLPRSNRLETQRDFYEFYQDYYHCTKPNVGAMQIVEPAVVVPTTGGWKLLTMGVLEVVADTPKVKGPIKTTPEIPVTPPREKPRVQPAPVREQEAQCNRCGSMIEARYAFCWKCGNPLSGQSKNPPGEWEVNDDVEVPADEGDEEQTVQHERRSAAGSYLFSSESNTKPERHNAHTRSVLKLLSVAGAGLIMLSFGVYGLMRWSAKAPFVNAAQVLAQSAPSAPSNSTIPKGVAEVPAKADSQPKPAALSTESDLTNLEGTSNSGESSDRAAVLQMLDQKEKEHPSDYRFPYERAKLVINSNERHSHDAAFVALTRAAEKALRSGKAREMLDRMEKDRNTDFHKLSHGHHQWNEVEAALRANNARALNAGI